MYLIFPTLVDISPRNVDGVRRKIVTSKDIFVNKAWYTPLRKMERSIDVAVGFSETKNQGHGMANFARERGHRLKVVVSKLHRFSRFTSDF